jgi:hypothetical protein
LRLGQFGSSAGDARRFRSGLTSLSTLKRRGGQIEGFWLRENFTLKTAAHPRCDLFNPRGTAI